MQKKGFNFWFNLFILVGMTIAVVIANVAELKDGNEQIIKQIVITLGAVMGVVNNVLSANGNIWTFFFGILDVIICSYANYDSGNTGVFLQHVLYFLPMQFVGLWQWRKRGASVKKDSVSGETKKVKARRLTGKQWAYTIVSFFVFTALAYAILYWIDIKQLEAGRISMIEKDKILLDASVVVLNCIGQVLMSWAFAEQWYIWLSVNVFSILLWTNRIISPDASSGTALIMLIKYSFYLLNSINGLRIWLQLSKQNCCNEMTEHHGCC